MARSCGIRIGPRRFELIVLDGNPKKHKITAYKWGEFPLGGDDPLHDAAQVLKEAAKAHDIPRENVGISIDTGLGAFRRVKLPFSDESKIEQVLKFEIESQLPQWNIDDVIVDHHILNATETESELLVSALPKEDLGVVLDICSEAGIEPLDAEFETTAMVNAAMMADMCHIDDAQLLVHIGETSTSVVVMDSGEVRDMRVIHLGALTHEAVQAPAPAPVEPNEEGEDADGEAREATAAPVPEPSIDATEALRRTEQAIKRIRRELGRTISASGTIHKIEAIYVCGLELPGMIGSDVLDVPVYAFDCFDEDGGQPAEGFGVLVAAYGVAIGKLGAAAIPASLRREEMRFTGAMERIEFPLAVAALLLCFSLGVVNILQFSEHKAHTKSALRWLRSSNNFMVGTPSEGQAGALSPVPDKIREYHKLVKDKVDPIRTPIESLYYVKGTLSNMVKDLRKDMGQDGAIKQPQSAFVGSCLVLGVLEDNGASWRSSLRSVKAEYFRGKQGKGDNVMVTIDVTFFADNPLTATQDQEDFIAKLSDQPWYIKHRLTKSESLENGLGVYIPNMQITVDVDVYYESMKDGKDKDKEGEQS